MATITFDGQFISAGVQQKPFPAIEKGAMKKVNGIIVHQTDTATANATFNSYLRGGNGAHFLIDKDGTIYQTASLKKKTWHIGRLLAKCFETYTCDDAQIKIGKGNYSAINKIEMHKTVPNRFPSNDDSIGIELVGLCILDPKYIKPGMTATQIEKIRGEKGVFEKVTGAQNQTLLRIVAELQAVLIIPQEEVYPHPRVSAKNPTEASTAEWHQRK